MNRINFVMPNKFVLPLLLIGLGCSLSAAAEVVTVGNSYDQAAQRGIEMPANGMTMKRVERWFGTPIKKYPPVGNPPITRWEYPNYIVYFEYDRVITSVLKHRR